MRKLKESVKIMSGMMCVGLVFVGCGDKSDKAEDTEAGMPMLELEGYHYDTIAQLPDSLAVPVDGGKYIRLKGQGMMPVRIGDIDITSLRDSLENLGRVTILNRSVSTPRLDSGYTFLDVSPDSISACGSYGNKLSISLCTPQLIVWEDYSYGYICHAAHGTYSTRYINYSIEKEKILGLSDFMVKGYENKLLELIRKKLVEDKVGLLVELDEVELPHEFEVTSSGIRFVYGLYEIAPYAEGEVVVDFQSYELSDVLSPDAMTFLYGPEWD